ncbi:leishmanolysin family protein, putative [Ichthyophthirius multifiliis]|uniref:Leishmanolysin family protein, putative n=1 Tax=Ichthyophthirius multifiliis TaxID=5932 RepID=G0QM08_ICHMU|nr:leishmanolysin family protein, putative [Ichthyophthirius multifiliis]EGR33745.1 leishmanolysin family protein, putative [Ichthyophthirius multifiliis]|eukprot:XP_004038969.1 leishmanolysin family protein, putative [Ichthyophthirius multifiliis]
MNASVISTQAYFSGFTTNLLRDTGYYAKINDSMEEQMFYGKGKGCEQVMGKCDIKLREYCDPKNEATLCDFHHYGFAECKTGLYNNSNCNNLFVYDNAKCFDVNSPFNDSKITKSNGNKFGTDSRCFNGSLLAKGYKQRNIIKGQCYKYECSANGQQVNIYIESVKLVCNKNSEQKTVENYTGFVLCPENITEFCKLKKICKNFCSQNGYCLNNKCECKKDFYGEDCSNKIPIKKK